MPTLDKLIMLSMAVNDMAGSKQFYEHTLGFKVTTDYGQGDKHWVSLELPGGGITITLTTAHENMKPGTMKLYVSTRDIEATHKNLSSEGASEVGNDLYGPGSGVKWLSIGDPDGNLWIIAESK
ncbi:MAG TPA: glyoxalase superfamily protein [Chitinophagaceae bacterium]|nr:glyoxalase superfamily protein [Chitinophagaceae bacterium]